MNSVPSSFRDGETTIKKSLANGDARFWCTQLQVLVGKVGKRKKGSEGRGSGGVESTGVSQRVRATGRDESQSVPSPEKLLKTKDLELPFFEGSLPSCSPHSAGYTRTSLHPYFPVVEDNKGTTQVTGHRS